jgi:D-lactate dehydrogenase
MSTSEETLNVDFSIADALSKDKFLQQLSKEDQEKFQSKLKQRVVKKDEILVKQGEPQTEAYIVQSGKLAKRHGSETTHIGPGSILGFLHFLNGDPSFATLTTEEDSVVASIDAKSFQELLEQNPSIMKAYVTFLSKQLREQSNVLQNIRSKMAPSGVIRIAFFDTKSYMKEAFEAVNKDQQYSFKIKWFKEKLSKQTAVLAANCQVVCCFVNCTVDEETIKRIAEGGTKLIAMRCAGYDNVDLEAAKKYGLSVTRVPAYSPYAVAEHAVTLMMTLNRKVHKAYIRVREFNFSLNGLVGFDMHGKTVGLLGTGQIGACTANILLGFGCKV